MKKMISILLSVLLVCALLTTTVFAAPADPQQTLTAWLQNADNTQFDYTDTSYPDSLVDWTAFTLVQSGAASDAAYADYIDEVVKNSFDSLYPSDLARIVLSTTACGLDARVIGGHDLLTALGAVDYTSQVYLSSLAFPLLAMDFSTSFDFPDSTKQSIINTLLAAQQADGGFPYCSVDEGWGISSDCDTTAMAVQALAPYYETDETVREAVDKALVYLKAQQFDTGAFGRPVFGTQSGESTAQVILALCALGLDPTAEEYCKNGVSPVAALESFISENGGGLNYANTEDPLTTYQLLQAYEAYARFQNGEPTLFTYTARASEPTTEPATDTTAPGTESEPPAETAEIPNTGAAVPATAVLAVLAAAAVLTMQKKHA